MQSQPFDSLIVRSFLSSFATWAILVPLFSAQAFELRTCSFPGEPGLKAPRCLSQTVSGHEIEIGRIFPTADTYAIRVDQEEPKRVDFFDQSTRGRKQPRYGFFIDLETVALEEEGVLRIYKIPSLLSLQTGQRVILSADSRLAQVSVRDLSGFRWSPRDSAEGMAPFDVDEHGLTYGRAGDPRRVRINPKIDRRWIDELVLLDIARKALRIAEFECLKKSGEKAVSRCVEKERELHAEAEAAIRKGEKQTYTAANENTPIAMELRELAPVFELVIVAGDSGPYLAFEKALLKVRGTSTSSAEIELPRENPFLNLD